MGGATGERALDESQTSWVRAALESGFFLSRGRAWNLPWFPELLSRGANWGEREAEAREELWEPGYMEPGTSAQIHRLFPPMMAIYCQAVPRKYVSDVTSVGQRSSPWPCNSMKENSFLLFFFAFLVNVDIKCHLRCNVRFPYAQRMLRQMH